MTAQDSEWSLNLDITLAQKLTYDLFLSNWVIYRPMVYFLSCENYTVLL